MKARMSLAVLAFLFLSSSIVHSIWADQLRLKSATIDTDVDVSQIRSDGPLSDRWFLIQFRDVVGEGAKKRLENHGVELGDYIPDRGFLAHLPHDLQPELLKKIAEVKWVGHYAAAMRISPELLKILQNPKGSEKEEPAAVNLEYFKKVGDEEVGDLERRGGVVFYRGDFVLSAWLKPVVIFELLHRGGVKWIEEYQKVKLLMFPLQEGGGAAVEREDLTELNGYESGLELLGVKALYEAGVKGDGEIVTVADTGLDRGSGGVIHDDFEGVIEDVLKMGPYNSTWDDPIGHGTHVAGLVLGRGVRSNGAFHGSAPQARLIVQKILNDFGMLFVPPDLKQLLSPAYDRGSRIHSNSWGTAMGGGKYDQFASSLDRFVWDNPDMVVVAAAGNSGEDANRDGVVDNRSLISPAIAKNSIAVGASENLIPFGGIQRPYLQLTGGTEKWAMEPIASDTPSNDENGMAAFSSRGPTEDGRIKPDIVAPGTNVVSVRSHHPEASDLWGAFNEEYVYAGGTSMATPLVSGSAALVREYLLKVKRVESPSAALIKAILLNGAKDLYPGQYGAGIGQEIPTHRPNEVEGWGRVDIASSTRIGQPEEFWFRDESPGLETRSTAHFEIEVVSIDQPLRVTLAYSDFPASVTAARALVNDLDLVLLSPSGLKFYPNGGSVPDRLNNVETIDVSNVESGTYVVEISAHQVAIGGRQPYAVVVTGGVNSL